MDDVGVRVSLAVAREGHVSPRESVRRLTESGDAHELGHESESVDGSVPAGPATSLDRADGDADAGALESSASEGIQMHGIHVCGVEVR